MVLMIRKSAVYACGSSRERPYGRQHTYVGQLQYTCDDLRATPHLPYAKSYLFGNEDEMGYDDKNWR